MKIIDSIIKINNNKHFFKNIPNMIFFQNKYLYDSNIILCDGFN